MVIHVHHRLHAEHPFRAQQVNRQVALITVLAVVLFALFCPNLGGIQSIEAQTVPHSERVTLSSGEQHTCALRADGTAMCWGEDLDPAFVPPTNERFVTISSGNYHICALRADGTPVCWGYNSDGVVDPPPGEQFVTISSGETHTCALKADGTPACWGENAYGKADPPSGEQLVTISSGGTHTCALRADGSPVCWGGYEDGRSDPPVGLRLTMISSGYDHTCGLTQNGSHICWGAEGLEMTSPPTSERFRHISSGFSYACALRLDGSPLCWGILFGEGAENMGYQNTTPVNDRFVAISSGHFQACGLRQNGSVVCWSSNNGGGGDWVPESPSERFWVPAESERPLPSVAAPSGSGSAPGLTGPRSELPIQPRGGDGYALIESCVAEPGTVAVGDPVSLYADVHVAEQERFRDDVLARFEVRYNNRIVFTGESAIREGTVVGETFSLHGTVEKVDTPGDYSLSCSVYTRDSRSLAGDDEKLSDYQRDVATFTAVDSAASPPESVDISQPRPTVNIHGQLTRTYLGGPPIRITLAIVHTILIQQDMTANLLVRVPSGWSLTGSGFASACTGICNAVYELTPGENKHIEMDIIPNEVGENVITAKVEWVLDDDSDRDIQIGDVEVEVYAGPSQLEKATSQPTLTDRSLTFFDSSAFPIVTWGIAGVLILTVIIRWGLSKR